MKSVRSIFVMMAVLLLALPLWAQKIAYVHSQKILSEYHEFVEVQNRINEIRDGYDAEYQQMVKEYNDLLDEIDSQSLLLSPEKKQEKMRLAQEKAMNIERFKYEKLGPEGELYRKNAEFSQPIIDKINRLIADIGEQEGYDFIFDSAVLLHSLPKYDLTDRILEELNKGSAASKGK